MIIVWNDEIRKDQYSTWRVDTNSRARAVVAEVACGAIAAYQKSVHRNQIAVQNGTQHVDIILGRV